LTVVPAGGHIFSGHPAKSVEPDSLLPMDHKFHAEMGLAASKLSRSEADPLARTFYEKYEPMIKTPEKGFRYPEVYDVKSAKIVNRDYLETQQDVRKTLQEAGLDVPFT